MSNNLLLLYCLLYKIISLNIFNYFNSQYTRRVAK